MQHARSVAGPLRRAHPASGATWNVQVVRGKMSSRCLWHACRALCAGLLLMLLGAAMATIGYYADTLSVAQEIRGNATVSVKDEARGFHLNNLSYAGPIVMGFGGFIVVAACVMTFEARDSAAKVTPARPAAAPRPAPRLASTAGVARWDQLGVYRLPALPLQPLPHAHPHRRSHARIRVGGAIATGHSSRKSGHSSAAPARFGSAPDLRTAARVAPPANALRRPLRRYALSVDEAPHSTHSASAAESECGSQSSLALDLHAPAGGGAGASGVTLRVRDNTRRRPPPLSRQPRLRDETQQMCVVDSRGVSPSRRSSMVGAGAGAGEESAEATTLQAQLQVCDEARACSASPPSRPSSPDIVAPEPAVLAVESIDTSEAELPSPVRPPSPAPPPSEDAASPSASPPPPAGDITITIAIEEEAVTGGGGVASHDAA